MLQKIKKYTLVSLAVLALTACGGGGGGSDGNDGLVTASSTGNTSSTSQTGVFIDSPVEGLLYETPSFSGETDVDGKFQYVAGETVKFYIGTYYLGEAKGATAVTPYQLYPNDENTALKVARLLQTIDADNDASNGITLVNQEQFSSFDSTVSPSSTYFEHELNNQLGLALTVTKAEAKQHLDNTISTTIIKDTIAPVFVSTSDVSVKENQRVALTIKATDSQSSIRYSLSGTDAFSFNINATTGVVTFKVAPDYETKKSYVITAIATDLANNEVRKNLTIKILDVDEYVPDTTAPTFRSQNVVSVNENQTSALTVKATDSQSSIRYSLSGTDAFHFNVNGTTGVVTFKVAPDYETKTTYNFTATATDTADNSVNQNVTVNILDINEVVPDTTAPVFISPTSVHVNENQTDVLTLTATDSQSTISYSILSEIDASSFNINTTTGVVTFKVAPDYEVKNRYIFKARATDSAGNKADQQITVVVSDVNENVADTIAPVFTSTNAVSVNENQTSALTLAATDTQSSVLYSLAGTNASSFNVNTTTGVVTFKSAPDYEAKSIYDFTARATDEAGNISTQDIKVTILDVNENASGSNVPLNRSSIRKVNLVQLAQNEGKTLSQYLVSEFEKKRPASFVQDDQKIFSPWSDATPSAIKYSSNNWASEFDFSGIAWNGIKAGALITNQHIVLAAHLRRNIGEKVYFHRKDGTRIIRTIIGFKNLKDYDSRLGDACIQKLNEPVPDDIKVYSILNSSALGDFSSLIGAPLITTDQRRKAFIAKVTYFSASSNKIYFSKNSKVPSFMYHFVVNGDSGNPIFMVVNGELTFIAALYGWNGNQMIAPFSGYQLMYDNLVKAIEDMKNIN